MASLKGIAALLALGGAFAVISREDRARKEYIDSHLPENDTLLEHDALEGMSEENEAEYGH